MAVGHVLALMFGGGKDKNAPKLGTPSTINGKPISGPGSTDPAADPATAPPTAPPSAVAAASAGQLAADTAAQRAKKRAAAGNTLATGPLNMPGGTPKSSSPPRTLLGQ